MDLDLQKEMEFECENEKQPESDKCLFHDEYIVDNEINREVIQREFQRKIKDYLSTSNEMQLSCIGYTKMPLFCIGYNIYDLTLEGKVFRNCVYFNKSSISGNVKISSTFCKSVSFSNCVFKGNSHSDFSNTQFLKEGNVDFSNARFEGKGNVWFSKAQFLKEGNVDFSDAQFLKEGNVDFSDACFEGKGYVSFCGCHFSGFTYFLNCIFNKNIYFREVDFKFEPDVVFRVKRPNLQNVSFLNSDITRIFFEENAKFGDSESKTRRYITMDERKLEENKGGCFHHGASNIENKYLSKDVTLGSLLTLYRNLRENYEYRLRYEEAGQFFVREMELKRNYSENDDEKIVRTNWFKRNFSLTGFYRLASYGEKFTMPILFSLSVMLGGFFVSMWQIKPAGIAALGAFLVSVWQINSAGITAPNLDVILAAGNATESVVTTFLQLRNEHLIWSDYIIKALGIVSLGLFAIPLRRKFERKFRH